MSILRHTTVTITVSLLACVNLKAQPAKIEKAKEDVFLAPYAKYIENSNETHLKEYVELLSIPSISSVPSHKPDAEGAASWIANKLKSIGITVQIIPTGGLPVVYGSWEGANGKPTILIYAHYDVQPVKESEWDSPPFSPKIENGKIFGRGASDDKSGVMIPIWAVEALLNTDKTLPVNVKFVFEGEEEVGSPNFHNLLAMHKELFRADFALNADGNQFNDSTPAVLMALRGGFGMEITVKTANVSAHSGLYGGKTPNAAVALSQIISSVYNKDRTVAVEGFYENVLPLTTSEKDMIKRIPYDPATDMKILGTTAEIGDTNYLPLERIWYRPTLEITGMQSGYTAPEGSSNIVPGTAIARINCRIVSNQDDKEIYDLIVKHINKNCPAGATVSCRPYGGKSRPIKFSADTKDYRYVSEALSKIYGKTPLQIAAGFSIGSLIDIKEQLGIYPYSLGFGLPDERWHGANEFFRLSSISKGQMVYCYYLKHLAEEESRSNSYRMKK